MDTNSPAADMPAHAEFGPSSLKYVSLCKGYHGREGTNATAEKGTRIHEALEIRNPSTLESEEEIQMYDTLLAEETEVFNAVFPTGEPTILREFRLTLDLDCKTPTFGTSDIVAYDDNVGLLVDYKTGISMIDAPRSNYQAKAYTLATFQMFPHIKKIFFAFLVPQRQQVLLEEFSRDEMDSLKDEISTIIREAEVTRPLWANGGQPPVEALTPNVNCRFCRHEENCPAMGCLVIEVAKRYRPDLLPEGSISSSDVEDVEALDKLYHVAKIVENWASSIKHKAMTVALAGAEFPTLRLKSMGANTVVREQEYLKKLAMQHGLTEEEVFEASDLKLTAVLDALKTKAPKGKKAKVAEAFEQEAFDLDIIEKGTQRFTLTSK